MIWKSVVGKLWATILLLVACVLFILTILLMQFFRNYILDEMTGQLMSTASKIAVMLKHNEDMRTGLDVAWELISEETKVVVVTDDNRVYYSPNQRGEKLSPSYFRNDPDFSEVFSEGETVQKRIRLPEEGDAGRDGEEVLVIGKPLNEGNGKKGAVFVYQSLAVMKETSRATTRLIFLAAVIAFIMTTVFAFFLSTRITSPLRKMRVAAFEVARGKFDTKVPKLTNDEIGELATAFNQMRKKLKINMHALNQEKEQLAGILKSMADGVITFSKDGTILLTNPPAESFLQLWYYEQGGDDLQQLPPALVDLFAKAVETEQEQVGEVSFQGRYWTVIVSPLYTEGNIRGAVAVLRDMTREKKLDKLRNDFVANVSHELRTPIAMLQGYSEALIDDVVTTEEERKEFIKVINEESERMGRLVNELLDLARMQSDQFQLKIEQVPIKPFCNRVIKKFAGLAREKNISLESRIESGDESFPFDPDRMEQVLTNLIDNALRHTPEGGRVEIRQGIRDDKLWLEVSDNGSGIPEEDLPFVFERFYKADKARTRGRSGTGLGLAIVKNIVDAHRGTIEVKSKIGQGTTFTVMIPRK
ncbi:ATP-binding protein [Caldibacillus debilis]|jgi:two-component system sensor histidine kinase ResE|uniref:histidine kinase n=1 Tax=Caldibacillus debilis GB1 TaxID=1339248 RepID=A0A420VEP3_9BACI|nr:ATP-binding protein [Caldibacillus debilis]RKO62101.1 Signal transduction histidine kinase [Caldibacillus debilis GB1]